MLHLVYFICFKGPCFANKRTTCNEYCKLTWTRNGTPANKQHACPEESPIEPTPLHFWRSPLDPFSGVRQVEGPAKNRTEAPARLPPARPSRSTCQRPPRCGTPAALVGGPNRGSSEKRCRKDGRLVFSLGVGTPCSRFKGKQKSKLPFW